MLSNYHSLAAHLNAITHVLSDINRASLFHINCFETGTLIKCLFSYLFERGWKRDLLDSTVPETIFSDRLHAVGNFYVLELFAVTECIISDLLQRRGKRDVLYRAPRKSRTSKFLQSFVQPHVLQLFAPAKRAHPDAPNALRELDIPQARAILEHPTAYLLQHTSRLEDHLLEVLAVLEGAALNLLNAFRDEDALVVLFLILSLTNHLRSVRHHQGVRVLEHLSLYILCRLLRPRFVLVSSAK